MRPFDAALGRRRVGTHDLDPELVQCATILGHAAATDAGTLVDVEDGVLVAVERHRFAIASVGERGGIDTLNEMTPWQC